MLGKDTLGGVVSKDEQAGPEIQEGGTQDDGQRSVSLGFMQGLVGYNLRLAQLRVFDHFGATMRKSGNPTLAAITPGLFRILLLVGENAGLNQSALARAVSIDRSTLVPILNKLQALGLVERRPSAMDKRMHALHLTAQGEDTVLAMQQAVLDHENEIAAGLSKSERATLLSLLAKLC